MSIEDEFESPDSGESVKPEVIFKGKDSPKVNSVLGAVVLAIGYVVSLFPNVETLTAWLTTVLPIGWAPDVKTLILSIFSAVAVFLIGRAKGLLAAKKLLE